MELVGSFIGIDVGSYVGTDVSSYVGTDVSSFVGTDVGSCVDVSIALYFLVRWNFVENQCFEVILYKNM